MNEEFAEIRKTLGMTQQQLAVALDVHISTIQSWQSGRSPIPGPAKMALESLIEKASAVPNSGTDAKAHD